MSMFRRKLLIAAALEQQGGGGDTDMGYVTDGLVFHLDGINRGCDPTAWTDLVNGFKFDCDNVIFNDDSLEFNGTNSRCANSTNAELIRRWGDNLYTIEVALERVRISTIESVFNAGIDVKKGIALMFWSDKSFLYPHRSFFGNPYTGKITCSLAYPNSFIDNKSHNKWLTSSGGIIPTKVVYVGSHDNLERTFKGKIYSIRIYNRTLSNEEILQNQEVDVNRFFGGVIPQ